MSFKELWIKDSKKLLSTFIVWSAIGYVLYILFSYLQHTLTLKGATYSIVRRLFLNGQVSINDPLWFLLTLFGVRFIANFILPERGVKYLSVKILTIVAIGYVIAYFTYRFNHRLLPYWVGNGAAGFAFFTMGYALKDHEREWWIAVPSILVYLVCSIVGFPMVDMLFNKLLSGNYLLWIPVALCSIVSFNTICQFICKYVYVRPLEIVDRMPWLSMSHIY